MHSIETGFALFCAGLAVCSCLVVSMLDCQLRNSGFNSQPRQKFGSSILLHLRSLSNSPMMNTLNTSSQCCQLEDETVRERTGHPPSYSVAKKIKSLTLHAHGCPRASARDCPFFFLLLVRNFRKHLASAVYSLVYTKVVIKHLRWGTYIGQFDISLYQAICVTRVC